MPKHAFQPLLVAEDDPNDMFLFTRLLNGAGALHPLLVALDQSEALRLLTPMLGKSRVTPRPAAIFVSLNLPRGGGLDLVAWIREQRALDDVPVLLMTRNPRRA